MGSELSTMSGGGRNVEACSEARTRRADHERPTPNVIPLGYASGQAPPPLLPDGEIRSVADDASNTSWSRSAVTVSTYSAQHSVLSTTDQSAHQQHREHSMPMCDTNSATAFPAAEAPLQQQQRRTQYSIYARQMRRRGRDGDRLGSLHRNSAVDFLFANEFFSRSDSTVGSEAEIDSGSGDDKNDAGRAHYHCSITPMETISPYRPGRPLSRGLAGEELFEHPLQHAMDGAPALASSPTAVTVISATSPPHAKTSSTGQSEKAASTAVSVVVSGIDGSSDLPPALTSSRNSSTASHDSKPSAAGGDKDGATPSPSSRPLSWRKRLLRPVSQSSSQAHCKGSATKRDPSGDAGAALSSQEEKKFKARKKISHPERPLERKHPHRANSSEVAAGASSEAVGAAIISVGEEPLAAGTEAPIRKESLRAVTTAELSELDLSALKARQFTYSERRGIAAETERLRPAGDPGGSASPALANEKKGVGVAGEYGSLMRASASPAHQQHATGEDDGGRRSASSGACPPRSSMSPPCHSDSFLKRFLGCNDSDGGSSTGIARHHGHEPGHRRRGGDGHSNRVAAVMPTCLLNSKHHRRRLMRASSGGGGHDLNNESCNGFFAPTQRSGQRRMLYGSDGEIGRSDDDEADLNSESGNSTDSMREAARMASGGGGAMVHAFGSFFDGSQSGSLHSVSSLHGPAWIGDYADGGMAEATAATGVPTLCDGGGARRAARHHPTPDLHPSRITGASVSGAGVLNTQSQRVADTLPEPTSPSPSPGANCQVAPSMPESGQSARDSPLPVLATPASVSAAEAPASRKRVESPAVIRRVPSATAPCRGAHSHIRAATEVSSGSSVFGSGSSGGSGIAPEVDSIGLAGSSRLTPPAEAVSPSLLSPPPRPQAAVTWTEAHSFRRGSVGGGNTDLSTVEGAAGSSTTPKSFSSDACRRSHLGNVSNSDGGAPQATTSVLASVQGSGDALRPTRADSKDLILRPDRATSANRRHSGRNDDAPGGSGSRQRRPRNRTHSSGARLSSFSFSSDSFLHGKVRGRLAKAAAAAAAAYSSSIERRRRMSGSGGTQVHARHHIHSDADSVTSGASPSTAARKAEADGRHDCRHHSSSGHHHHKRHGINTSSDRKREMRSRRHLRSGYGNGSEMGSLVAGLDDLLLGNDGKAVSGNLTALYVRSVSSSSSSLAPSSRNSSANGGVGGSGNGVGSGSVRALRKRAAKARDLSASSSVDSESNSHLRSHWTASALPMHRLPLMETSSSSFATVAAVGSASGAAAGGACGMKLPSFKLDTGVDIRSSAGACSDFPASSGGCRLTSECNAVVRPHHPTHQQQQQPRTAIAAPHEVIGKGHSNSSNRRSQSLRSPAAVGSATTAAALPQMHSGVMSRNASPGVGVAANMSVPMPMINGCEKRSRRPTVAPSAAGVHSSVSVSGAHLPRMPPPTSLRCASSKSDGDGDSVTLSFLDVNSRGDGGAAASLLAGPSRDSSTKRRRPTTQNFTPWSVDMSRFKALQEAQESSS
ncbi:hypothetical protein CUR178_07659 [Leishmania enriettii]|uniref:Uncharacterized protein n=1 Tax=Leishmania enriettii TaxID=5663 RepID=A0A836HRP8_LEIEN|nr:hypothetical protein CUR178_07659 [Leishmania enriettii]